MTFRSFLVAFSFCCLVISGCDDSSGGGETSGTSGAEMSGGNAGDGGAAAGDGGDSGNSANSATGGSNTAPSAGIENTQPTLNMSGTCDEPEKFKIGEISTGTTQGAASEVSESSCGGGGLSPEAVFRFVADRDSTVCLSTERSAYDTVLFVRADACLDADAEVACNDTNFAFTGGPQSVVEFEITEGTEYFIIVDGFGFAGEFFLSGSYGACAEARPETCNARFPCEDGLECEEGRCIRRCENDVDCMDPRSICEAEICVAVECRIDDHCPIARPLCVENSCVECRMNGDCGDDRVCFENACFDCLGDGDCESGVCEDMACVECRDATQCEATPATPFCGGNNCVPCLEDTHCPLVEGGPAVYCVDYDCVECRSDMDCSDGLACFNNTCVERARNVTCEAPNTYQIGKVILGDLAGWTESYQGYCRTNDDFGTGGEQRAETVFEFTAETSDDVCISLGGSGFDTVLYVREAPEDCDSDEAGARPCREYCEQSQALQDQGSGTSCTEASDCLEDETCTDNACARTFVCTEETGANVSRSSDTCRPFETCILPNFGAEEGVCEVSTEVGCNDDDGLVAGGYQSALSLALVEGKRYYIFVDQYSEPIGGESTSFKLSSSYGDCTENRPPECDDTGDCEDGLTCLQNFCTVSCDSSGDATCPERLQVCQDDACLPIDCETSDDCDRFSDVCLLGETALENRCVRCVADGDCFGNDVCVNNACEECGIDAHCYALPLSNGEFYCAENECVECTLDAHCAFGFCNAETFSCVQCTEDSECSGLFCENSLCVECRSESDCPNERTCGSDGVCYECDSDNDCAGNLKCNDADGRCVGCIENADCANGEVCDDNRCVAIVDAGSCAAPIPYTVGEILRGDTNLAVSMELPVDDANDMDDCTTSNSEGEGNEYVLSLVPSETGTVCLSVSGDFDTITYVRGATCTNAASQLICDDDGGTGLDSLAVVDVTAGETYHIVVDGLRAMSSGLFTLTSQYSEDGTCTQLPTCAADADCAPDEVCREGTCGQACTSSDECDFGALCLVDGVETDGTDGQCRVANCRNDDQCGSGICFEYNCVACLNDSDCAYDEACSAAKTCERTFACHAQETGSGTACASDAECGADEACNDDGVCERTFDCIVTTDPETGVESNNCRARESCEESVVNEMTVGQCVFLAGCRAREACLFAEQETGSGTQCSSIGDCAEDEECAAESNTCERTFACSIMVSADGVETSDCREGEVCKESTEDNETVNRCVLDETQPGACVFVECTANNDCNSRFDGLFCVDYECVECAETSDCEGQNEVCINNECIVEPECGAENLPACPDGEVCYEGFCAEPAGTCDEPTAIIDGTYVGNTSGGLTAHTGTNCSEFSDSPRGNGPEAVYVYTASMNGQICVDTENSDLDTVVYVRAAVCEMPSAQLVCDDDGGNSSLSSSLQFAAEADTEYFIFVDSFRQAGSFQLNVGPCVVDDD